MAVAFDAVAIPSLALYTATFSWTHTPVGTPRGVAVVVVQEGSNDQVSGVTYGGVAMTRVRFDVRTATEAGGVYIYFLGASVPVGAQTVVVTLTGTADTNAVSLSVTAATTITAVDVSNGLDAGIIANPSLAISPTVAAVIFYGIFSGLAAPVTTVETGSTHVAGKDYGTDSAMWARKSVAAGGATTIGYTAASDDVCHSALAIKELVAQTFYQTLTGVAIGLATVATISTRYLALLTVAIGQAVLLTAKMFSQTLTAVAQGAAGLARIITFKQALVAVATGAAVLSRLNSFYRTLTAVATGSPVLYKGMYKNLIAVSQGVAGLSKGMYLTLTATATGVPTLVKTCYVALVASAVGMSGIVKGMSKTLEATAIGTATLNTVLTVSRVLEATAQGIAGLTAQLVSEAQTFYRALSAVAQGTVTLVTQRWKMLTAPPGKEVKVYDLAVPSDVYYKG